jgi:hypothetical protein
MKSAILLSVFVFLTYSSNAQVITMANARIADSGAVVTIKGIVTNGTELKTARYIQDNTGGLVLFPTSTAAASIKRGDSVLATGTLTKFNGLLEMSPITTLTVINSNNALPAPIVVTAATFNVTNQGRLVRFLNGRFTGYAATDTFSSTVNYNFTTNGGAVIIVRPNAGTTGALNNIPKTIIPSAAVNITGECSVFSGVYQLVPRDLADIQLVSAVSDVNKIDGFEVAAYPNPANEFFNVSLKNDHYKTVSMSIVNDLGQVLQVYTLNDLVGKSVKQFPTTGLGSGFYNLVFNVENQVLSTRLQVVK